MLLTKSGVVAAGALLLAGKDRSQQINGLRVSHRLALLVRPFPPC